MNGNGNGHADGGMGMNPSMNHQPGFDAVYVGDLQWVRAVIVTVCHPIVLNCTLLVLLPCV
jgi:hypothetical protein